MKKHLFLFLMFFLPLEGKNPYATYYHDCTGGSDVTKEDMLESPTGNPRLFKGMNPMGDWISMMGNGYVMLGYSNFNGLVRVNKKTAISQGKNVHAKVVLMYSNPNKGRRTGTTSFVFPGHTTILTNGSIDDFGTYVLKLPDDFKGGFKVQVQQV